MSDAVNSEVLEDIEVVWIQSGGCDRESFEWLCAAVCGEDGNEAGRGMIGVCNSPCCGDGVGDGGAGMQPGLLEGFDEFFEESGFVAEERSAAGDIEEEGVGEGEGIESDDRCEAAE